MQVFKKNDFVDYFDKNRYDKNKPLLILDLDETIIHAKTSAFREDLSIENFDWKTKEVFYGKRSVTQNFFYFYKRPFLNEFLLEISKHYQLAIWSTSDDEYVWDVIENVFKPLKIDLFFAWSRERAVNASLLKYELYSFNNNKTLVKDLRKLKIRGVDLKKTLILDDTPIKLVRHYGNLVKSERFEPSKSNNYQRDDDELKKALKYLLKIKDEKNFRSIEKRGWRTKI